MKYFIKFIALIALLLASSQAYSQGRFMGLKPAFSLGADTYMKGYAGAGFDFVNIESGYDSISIYLVGLEYEYGVEAQAFSAVGTFAFIGRNIIVPAISLKQTLYQEHETNERGHSTALGMQIGFLGVFMGVQDGIIDGENRKGVYGAIELGI
jgi:hypothetical protein